MLVVVFNAHLLWLCVGLEVEYVTSLASATAMEGQYLNRSSWVSSMQEKKITFLYKPVLFDGFFAALLVKTKPGKALKTV